MKKIVFIFLVLLLTACSFYFVKFDLLEENKGAVILKEYPDSVGQIKTHIYQVYSVEGSYKKLTIRPENDFFNVGDTIK